MNNNIQINKILVIPFRCLHLYYVYFLFCGRTTKRLIYCGYTKNLENRLEYHESGKGGRFTRSHQPVELVYWEEFTTRKKAIRRERELKKLPRREKLRKIRDFKMKQST